MWDAERDGPLFENRDEQGDKPKKDEELTTSVVLNQPAEAPGAHPEDEGVAIPAAAEGTTALPVKAIVQAEEGGGGKAAGPDVDADAEKKVGKTGDHEHEDDEVDEAEAGVDASEHEQEQDAEDLVDEEH